MDTSIIVSIVILLLLVILFWYFRTGNSSEKPTEKPVPTEKPGPIYSGIRYIGCYKDGNPNDGNPRSLETYLGSIKTPKEGAALAKKNGMTMFGCQYGTECWASKDAEKRYNIYGKSNDCNKNGMGGTWCNDIYQIL